MRAVTVLPVQLEIVRAASAGCASELFLRAPVSCGGAGVGIARLCGDGDARAGGP